LLVGFTLEYLGLGNIYILSNHNFLINFNSLSIAKFNQSAKLVWTKERFSSQTKFYSL
jgi:hypothetical protein